MKPFPFSLALALALAGVAPTRAQSTAAVSPADAPDDAVRLNPFEVRTEKDNGYIASDSAVGGRLSLNLLEMPADTTILTREFLDDIAVTSMTDAYAWMVNTEPLEPGNPDWGQNVSIRGLPVAPNTRNYVRYDTTIAEFNTERLEQARGPNSILFGETPSGGAMNTNTKQAKFRNFEDLRLRADTEGTRSILIDVNRKLTNTLAARVNVSAVRRRTWIERFHDDQNGFAGDLTYRPWRNTEIRLEGELNRQEIDVFNYVYTDNSSAWDGVTAITAPGTGSPGGGLTRFNTDKLVVSPAWGNRVMNFRGFAQTSGSTLNIVDDNSRPFLPARFPVLPRRSFRIVPPEAEQIVRPRVASLTLQHSFDNGIVVRLSGLTSAVKRNRNQLATSTNHRIDVNRIRPDGTPNPNFGKSYSEGSVAYTTTDQYVNDLQLVAAYPLKTRWFTQSFSAMAERRVQLFRPLQMSIGRANGTTADVRNANNQVVYWRYWDEADASFVFPHDGDGYNFVETQTLFQRTASSFDSLQINTVGRYFNNRVVLVAGVRKDNYWSGQRSHAAFDLNGQVSAVNYNEYKVDYRAPAIGLTYFPWRAIGIYANYSEGYLPTFPPVPFIETHPYTAVFSARSKTAGLRFRLFDGAVVGSAGYYQSIELNRFANQSSTDFNQIWNELNQPEHNINGGQNYADTQDLAAHGYELDLTTNLFNRLRLKTNFSTGTSRQTNTVPGTRAYLAKYLPEWNTALSTLTTTDPTRASNIRTRLANINNLLSSAADGRDRNGKFKWRANVFGTYSFKTEWLKNVSVGGGANFYGKQLIGNPTNNPFAYIYAKEYYILTATASYRFKLRNIPTTFAVNISNLLDYDDPIYSSVGVYQGFVYRNGFRYVDPRRATFTATLKF